MQQVITRHELLVHLDSRHVFKFTPVDASPIRLTGQTFDGVQLMSRCGCICTA